MRMPRLIEPHTVLEIYAINHQRIALPVADGIPVPERIGFLRMRASVEVNLVESRTVVIGNHHNDIFTLHELVERTDASDRARQASGVRAVRRRFFRALLRDIFGGGQKFRFARIDCSGATTTRRRGYPHPSVVRGAGPEGGWCSFSSAAMKPAGSSPSVPSREPSVRSPPARSVSCSDRYTLLREWRDARDRHQTSYDPAGKFASVTQFILPAGRFVDHAGRGVRRLEP